MTPPAGAPTIRVVGRYALYQAIASGGMATVFLGRLLGPVGFARTVAVKRLHPQFASDPEFVAMFLDEARLAARIRHPNVVPTLDVVASKGELFLVMEYVHGEALSKLMRTASKSREAIPIPVAVSILSGVLQGLDAAHNAKSERGVPLQIVHRDVSPQNILLGHDGQARLLDFGVARAIGRSHSTQNGQIKGKVAYMSPEQVRGESVESSTDVYAAAVVLWEVLAMRRLYQADTDTALFTQVLEGNIPPPSRVLMEAGNVAGAKAVARLDAVVMAALSRDKGARSQTALDLARALEAIVTPASPAKVAEWVQGAASTVLLRRASLVAEIESSSANDVSTDDLERIVSRTDEGELDQDGRTSSGATMSSNSIATRKEGHGAPDSLATAREIDGRTLEMPTISLGEVATDGAVVARSRLAVHVLDPSDPGMPHLPKRSLLGLALGVGATAIVAGVSIAFLATRSADGPAISQVAATAGLVSAEIAQATPTASAATPPLTSVASASPPARSAEAPAPRHGEAPSGLAKASAARLASPSSDAGPAKPPSVRPVSASCDPPFTYEKDGLKHYRAECF